MPLPLPNLDDRTFDDLVAQMLSLIPRHAVKWTNHNPSDPGITLLELFAWLTEMVIFRMNQIHDRSYMAFLELLGVEPSGPQAELTFMVSIPKAALPYDFKIGQGTRIAAIDDRTGGEIIFETCADILPQDLIWENVNDTGPGICKVMAVNTIAIENEFLDISSGLQNQESTFKQGPVFLDKWNESNIEMNPRIQIHDMDGKIEDWHYRTDLLESGHEDRHFMVGHLAGCVRFGDGLHGKIPAKGGEIFSTYHKLGGVTGNVDKGKITQIMDIHKIEGVAPSLITVTNEYPASGGMDTEVLENILSRGLKEFQERYRAVSDEDFEYLVKRSSPGRVARVKVVPDKNLERTTPVGEGHISIIILPACDFLRLSEDALDYSSNILVLPHSFQNMKNAMKNKNVWRLRSDILRYLNARRLITTIVHTVVPEFSAVSLKVRIISKTGIDLNALKMKAEKKIAKFLDPYTGWEDGCGWPFGRNVYRSEVYQQIEGIEGVNHVEEMWMNGSNRTSMILVKTNDLVCLKDLIIEIL